jgi:transposase-like protein
MEDEIPEELQRWTAKRRVALVTSILKGDTSAQEAARKHGLTVAEVEEWKEKFLFGAENALRSKPRDDEEQQQEQLRRLKQKVADLVIEVDVLREATKNRPFVPKKSEE